MVGTSRQGGEAPNIRSSFSPLIQLVVLELVLNPGDGADPNLSTSPAQPNPTVQAPLTDWNHLC